MDNRILLLCEGKDDIEFLNWLFGEFELAGLAIRRTDGKDVTADKIRAILQDPELGFDPDRILVIFDADSNADKSRNSIAAIINQAIPGTDCEVYLFPDNSSPGELEDLYMGACINHELKVCVDAYIECAKPHIKGTSTTKVAYSAYTTAFRAEQRSMSRAKFGDELDLENENIKLLVEFVRAYMAKSE